MGQNILVADDMALNRKLIKSVLQKNLHDVVFFDAENGNEAIDFIRSKDIDLVILDLIMPEKDGFEVIKEIKENERYHELPIIVNSAVDEIKFISKALEMGANDYFTKPLSIEQIDVVLPLKVKNALKSYEQTKELYRINKRMKEELRFANILQHTLIDETKSLKRATMWGRYIPSTEVGGDFFDCVEYSDSTWFIIADVCGHGVASAMISSMIKVVFNSCTNDYTTPNLVLRDMNNIFCKMIHSKYFFTAFVGVIRDDILYYANAGHTYPLLIRSDKQDIIMLEQNGYMIGAFQDAKHDTIQISMGSKDMIMLYTDGILESEIDEKPLKTCEDMLEVVHKYYNISQKSPEKFIDVIIKSFGKDNSRNIKDDVAIMLVNKQ